MLAKGIIVAFLLIIVWCLGTAFYYLLRDQGRGERTVWRLTWRVGLSLVLLGLIYLAFLFGWVQPSTPGPIGLRPPVTG